VDCSPVSTWRDNHPIAALPLTSSVKSRLFTYSDGFKLFHNHAYAAAWTSAPESIAPFLLANRIWPRKLSHPPLVLDLDWTQELQEELAPYYFGRPSRKGVSAKVAFLLEEAVWDEVSLFTPWSNWVANSLRRQGVAANRIEVIEPGVDLDHWQPHPELKQLDGRLHILFVGGDFERKGGDLLLAAFASGEFKDCELDIVTNKKLAALQNVHFYQASPNSDTLKSLYARADVLVLPTRADCTPITIKEAMACGLPVLATDVGSIPEMVTNNHNGWLTVPTVEGVHAGLKMIVTYANRLQEMGAVARRIAEQRFDAKRNDQRVVALLLAVATDP
jgi:glycosyltransferase involved in cell wall biosynthesis